MICIPNIFFFDFLIILVEKNIEIHAKPQIIYFFRININYKCIIKRY